MKYNLYSTRVCSGFPQKTFHFLLVSPISAIPCKLLITSYYFTFEIAVGLNLNFFAYYASSLRFSFVFGVVLLKFLLKLHSMAVQLPGHNFLLFFFTLFYIFGLSLLKFVMLTMCSIICSKKKEELVLGDRVPLVISVAQLSQIFVLK